MVEPPFQCALTGPQLIACTDDLYQAKAKAAAAAAAAAAATISRLSWMSSCRLVFMPGVRLRSGLLLLFTGGSDALLRR